jgi:hypothetical protein
MTDDQMQTLQSDIAYLKALAKEGEHAPLLGGSILAVAGLSFGAASLGHWALVTGRIPGGLSMVGWAWLAAMAVFFTVLFTYKARNAVRPGADSAANRAGRSSWVGAGYALFTLAFVMSVAAWRTHSPVIFYLFPSVVLAFYGASWAVAASMTRRVWLWAPALGSFFGAAGLAFLVGTPELYLAYAVCLFLVAFVPGLVLMRGEPAKAA